MTTTEVAPQGTVEKEGTWAETGQEKRARMRVRVFGKWCKGCGLCIAFCPQQVFEADVEQRPVVAHPERCVGCQWCVIHCPDFAIIVDEVEIGEDKAVK
ncbi:MAG: ferredoxin family protein [Anaerolineales bacterium]